MKFFGAVAVGLLVMSVFGRRLWWQDSGKDQGPRPFGGLEKVAVGISNRAGRST